MSTQIEHGNRPLVDSAIAPAKAVSLDGRTPPHGRIKCGRCFPAGNAEWGKSVIKADGWLLENNPCAWGASDPIVLILGVSKGTNQTAKIARMRHEEIPFKGERPNLTKLLVRLGLISESASVDEKISVHEREFAFGSLIRCSIAWWDPAKGAYTKAGQVVNRTAIDPEARLYVLNCAEKHLGSLSTRTKLVVMLSNDDDYMDSCFKIMKQLYPDVMKINDVSYGNAEHTWVHVIHPSGSSGRHIPAWLHGTSGKQARKREFAIAAVRHSGAAQLLRHGT